MSTTITFNTFAAPSFEPVQWFTDQGFTVAERKKTDRCCFEITIEETLDGAAQDTLRGELQSALLGISMSTK